MKKMAILLALTAALVRQISFADSTDDTPPGASHFGGEWCKVYGTSSPGQFQEILAKQVGLGRWIALVSETVVAPHEVQYTVAVCSKKPQ